MSQDDYALLERLHRRLLLQETHCWHVPDGSIKRLIPIAADAWLYWRDLFLDEPEEQNSSVVYCASDGLSPILSLGQADDETIAALVATDSDPCPVWIAPADFIRDDGPELMKGAPAYHAERPLGGLGIGNTFLQAAAVTTIHPDKCSERRLVSLSKDFERLLSSHDLNWSYQRYSQGLSLFD